MKYVWLSGEFGHRVLRLHSTVYELLGTYPLNLNICEDSKYHRAKFRLRAIIRNSRATQNLACIFPRALIHSFSNGTEFQPWARGCQYNTAIGHCVCNPGAAKFKRTLFYDRLAHVLPSRCSGLGRAMLSKLSLGPNLAFPSHSCVWTPLPPRVTAARPRLQGYPGLCLFLVGARENDIECALKFRRKESPPIHTNFPT